MSEDSDWDTWGVALEYDLSAESYGLEIRRADADE